MARRRSALALVLLALLAVAHAQFPKKEKVKAPVAKADLQCVAARSGACAALAPAA
jgi:hypothetical protein